MTDYDWWRTHVINKAEPQGLAQECLEEYEYGIQHGDSPAKAAWCALYEWDCLDIESRYD